MASIAYCLHNDADFRSYFLKSVCEAAPDELSAPFDILIENKLWGDLVLSQNERKVYVVECKIDADMKGHQDPSTDEFWREGYGKHMVAQFPVTTELCYIVLGYYKRKLSPRAGPRIRWWQKSWESIDGATESQMISDLYNLLGDLGVTRFRSRITNNMRKASNARDASETYAVLESAYDLLGLEKEKFSPLIGYSSDGESWDFGLTIHTTRRDLDLHSNHGRLRRSVNPTGGDIGWFGYSQADRKSGVCFSVWLYCGKGAEKELEKRLKKSISPGGYVYVRPESGTMDIYIEVRMPASIAEKSIQEGDKEWFVRTIEAAFSD